MLKEYLHVLAFFIAILAEALKIADLSIIARTSHGLRSAVRKNSLTLSSNLWITKMRTTLQLKWHSGPIAPHFKGAAF